MKEHIAIILSAVSMVISIIAVICALCLADTGCALSNDTYTVSISNNGDNSNNAIEFWED